MKKLILIGGTMGVGKTSVGQCLKKRLEKSVFLDGDWCWDADPFQVTDETKTMVMDNICTVLNNFIHCSAYESVIFCWVMHEQAILDEILNRLDLSSCHVVNISLTADEKRIKERLMKDIKKGIRTEDILARSLARIPNYEKLNTIKICTNDKTVEETAEEIMSL